MATFGIKASQSNVFSGLNTLTHTVANTDLYTIEVRANIPPSSSLSIVINLNGSAKATSTAPTPDQQEVDLKITLNCTASDVVTIVMTSSAAVDKQPIAIKGTAVIRQGL